MEALTKKKSASPSLKLMPKRLDKLVVTTKIKKIIVTAAYYLVLCSLSFVFIYPFLKMIITSVMSDSDLVNITVNWLPTELVFANYGVAFKQLGYKSYFINSMQITLIGTLGHLISCSLAGYGFARYKFKGNGILFAVVILSMLVPVQTIIFPLYIQYSKMGLIKILKGYVPILLPCFFGYGLNGAFFIFLFRQFFAGLPKEMEEAARIDGCGALMTFFRIMLPMSKASLLVSTVLSVVWHWNDYFEPNIYITNGGDQVLPSRLPALFKLLNMEETMEMVEEMGGFLFNNGMLMAGTFLVVLPILIIYAFLQKQFMEGVERSGLTGM